MSKKQGYTTLSYLPVLFDPAFHPHKSCVGKGLTISFNDLLSGDLVFFSHDTNWQFMNIAYVAICVRDGYIMDASSSI